MVSDTYLICFKAITTFTNELAENFGKKQHSLKLYCRLINKTTVSHEKAIHKHIETFRNFCKPNREAILKKDENLFETSIVEYSSRVYINFKPIFKSCDAETKEIIWKHLLTILALVDPSSKAKELLKEHISIGSKESQFLSDIITKVEEHVDPNSSNPMEAVSSIMNAGIFNDLMGNMNNGLQDGSLDISTLMGTVQNMIGTLNNVTGSNETGGGNPMEMINTMMGQMMQNIGGGSEFSTTTTITQQQVAIAPSPSKIEEIEEEKKD